MLPRNKLAVIHIAKTQIGMTEAEYRDMLAGFGVETSMDLTVAGFKAVMKHFEFLGFKSKNRRKPTESKDRLESKAYAILSGLGLQESYADGMAKHMFGVDSWRWLNAGQLHSLVAALSYHQKRQSK